jgi:hypothetical protein
MKQEFEMISNFFKVIQGVNREPRVQSQFSPPANPVFMALATEAPPLLK